MKGKIKLDPIYMSILKIIHKKTYVHPTELAELFDVSRQAMDYRLKVLVEAGYVDKEYVQGKVYYKLTDVGLRVISNKWGGGPSKLVEKEDHWREKGEMNHLLNQFSVLPVLFLLIGVFGLLYFSIFAGDILRGFISLLIWLLITGFSYLVIRKAKRSYVNR